MVKVEVIGAFVDGQGPGSIVSVNEKSARYLVSVGYGKIVEDVEVKKPKAEEPKAEAKPKAKTKSRAKKSE